MLKVLKEFYKCQGSLRFFSANVKHFARSLTGDRVTNLNENTLTGRFLVYLGNNEDSKNVNIIDKVGLISLLKSRPSDIKSFDTTRLLSVLTCLNDRAHISNKQEFNQLLNLIDEGCCERVDEFNIEDTLRLLGAFMSVIPHRITGSHYYHCALQQLLRKLKVLSKDQLVHLLFFIGLSKKTPITQSMIRKCLQHFDEVVINELTKEDICILCNSTFKTSTKIQNKLLLNKIKTFLNDNLYLLNDSAVFVTLIKTLRHNRYQDEDILGSITCTIFFNRTLQYYSFGALCHILALYADYLYYDENILKAFTEKCLEHLRNSTFKSYDAYLQEQPRTKDIKRLLWALSNLNFKLDKNDIESVIIPQIMMRVEAGEFRRDLGSAIQIILYLWMMQYKALELIRMFLTKEVAKSIVSNNSPSQDSLNLLLTCIHYEDPDLYQTLEIHPAKSKDYNEKFQLAKRPTLQTIIDNFKIIGSKNNIDKYQVCCQVPNINIVGIIGFRKRIYKTVNIEVLDDYTCLKNTNDLPTGLMDLKLRILDKCNEGLVVIEKPDIMDCSDSEIRHILEDEISLVC